MRLKFSKQNRVSIKNKEVCAMFSNRKSVKDDASQLFNNNNFGFNTDLFKKSQEPVKEEKNSEQDNTEETESWAQWWKVNPSDVHRINWRLHEKIVLSLEVLMIIYFVLWHFGLVPMF